MALHTGILNGGPDQYYNFWSGIGSDLGEATLISAVGIGVYTGVRRVNCHTKGCWRIGKHRLDGTPYVLCRHHHPDVPSKGATHAAHPRTAPALPGVEAVGDALSPGRRHRQWSGEAADRAGSDATTPRRVEHMRGCRRNIDEARDRRWRHVP